MRIGFDARTLRDDYPGIGRYAFNLLSALQPELAGETLVVFYDPEAEQTRYDLARLAVQPGVETVPFACDLRGLSQQWALPRLLRAYGVEVFHAPYCLTAWMRLPCPLVLSLHDLIPLAYPPSMPSLRDRLAYWLGVRLALAAARRVIVPSQASLADLRRFFRGAARRAVVIPDAAAPEFERASPEAIARVRERYRIAPRYILHVGSRRPHKNLETLLAAYARYHAEAPALSRAGLVLAGLREARDRVAELGLGASVSVLGSVPDDDLVALYSGAACVAVPSLYEGFGLPVLEAMACGAPVLAANASSLPEVAGDAAVLLPAQGVAAWAEALLRVLGDAEVAASLRARGLARAAQFSWPAAARATLELYGAVTE